MEHAGTEHPLIDRPAAHSGGRPIMRGWRPRAAQLGYGVAWAGLLAINLLLPAPSGLSRAGMAVLAIVFWASIMWVSEAMPLGITGLGIPLLLILTHAIEWPLRNGLAQPPFELAFSGFTNDVVWLCLFAFMVGTVMRLAGLDRRVAISILHRLRVRTDSQVIWGLFGANLALCFLLPAANARTAAMLPVVSSVADQLATDDPRSSGARKAILIQSLVYGSMIAGVAIMTAHLPNFILVKLFADHGLRIGFFQWFALNAPYLGMFGVTQLWVKRFFRAGGVPIAGGAHRLASMHAALGPMSGAEMALLVIMGCVALLFLLGKGSPIFELHSLPIGVVALIGMMLLFIPGVLPFGWRAIQADTAWGTFLLIGGALTLTSAMASSGLAVWLADNIHVLVSHRSWWAATLLVIIGTHVIRLGMLSNVAAVALLAPITYALGLSLHLNAPVFAALICNGDSFSYILPTQITAGVIAYGSGAFTATEYARLGIVSTVISIAYTMLVIVPWYALLGLPLWNPNAPWPF
jgi:sodium-dependent dicarboxylate transporter 2/3/5